MRRRRTQNKFSLFAFQDIITSVTGIVIFVTLLMSLELIQRHPKSAHAETADLIRQLKQQLIQNQQASELLQQQIDAENQEIIPEAFQDATTLQQTLTEIRELQQRVSADAAEVTTQKSETEKQLNEIRKSAAERRQEAKEIEDLKNEIAHKSEQLKKLEEGKRLIFRPAKNTPKTHWLVDVSGKTVLVARMGVKSTPQQFASYEEFRNWLIRLSPASDYCMVVLRPETARTYQEIFKMLDQQHISFGYDAIDDQKIVIDPKEGAGF
ncbi:hypothetical protein [Gimesia algae]|uniref:Chromosome partition protein Smc n=1 Tax=Gimesia algae TaxID=2527971 RepID=A0A517VKZ6_9PLAN|nr:hypothetical protein [Gimesia algae]QDT93667.1 hypothetical protein Pan161_53490 [Gimesia algae]